MTVGARQGGGERGAGGARGRRFLMAGLGLVGLGLGVSAYLLAMPSSATSTRSVVRAPLAPSAPPPRAAGSTASLASSAPPPSAALSPEQTALAAAEAQVAAALARSRALAQQAAAASTNADKASLAAAAMAARIQAAEAEIGAAQARLALVQRAQAMQQARLADEQQPVVELTGMLQLLARKPAISVLAQPGTINDLVHARAILDATLPEIERRTAGLRAEMNRSRALKSEAELALKTLSSARERLAA